MTGRCVRRSWPRRDLYAGSRLVLRHPRAPVVRLEERSVVLLREEAEEAGHVLRRAELPAERLLVRLEERQEHLVAELLVEVLQQQGALAVEEPGPVLELSLAVVRHVDAVRERDRRDVVRATRVRLPARDDAVEVGLALGVADEERAAVLSERLLEPLLLPARPLHGRAPVLVRDFVGEAVVHAAVEEPLGGALAAQDRVERLTRDEERSRRRLPEAV